MEKIFYMCVIFVYFCNHEMDYAIYSREMFRWFPVYNFIVFFTESDQKFWKFIKCCHSIINRIWGFHCKIILLSQFLFKVPSYFVNLFIDKAKASSIFLPSFSIFCFFFFFVCTIFHVRIQCNNKVEKFRERAASGPHKANMQHAFEKGAATAKWMQNYNRSRKLNCGTSKYCINKLKFSFHFILLFLFLFYF